MGRYDRNHPAISALEQETLKMKSVLVAGCGGLGGYIIEILGRAGVGRITAVDGDSFVESNLNRQLLSDTGNIGQEKAVCAARRMALVNPCCEITPFCGYIAGKNAEAVLQGHDVAVDALDSGDSRIILAKAAAALRINLVSGAISGWHGRVFVLKPGEDASFLWQGNQGVSAGNLACTAACVAAVQAAETLKLLLGRSEVLSGRMLEMDLNSALWEEIPIIFKNR